MRSQLLNILSSVIVVFTIVACSTSKPMHQSQVEGPVLELYKGACFGTCPVYRLSYYSDGTLLYEGHRFTDRKGIFVRKVNSEEASALEHNLAQQSWAEYQTYYESQLPDLPMSVIKHGGKEMKFKEDAPEKLMVLGRLMEKIAKSGDWQRKVNFNYESGLQTNELTLKTTAGKSAQDVLADFPTLDLEVAKKISNHMQTWLIRFDQQKVSPGQAYMALSTHPDVEMVEFDVQLQLREE